MIRTRSLRALMTAVATVALSVAWASSAGAAAKNGGDAAMVGPGTSRALAAGGSQAEWELQLPGAPASNCSGDSANDAFFVYSFLAPSGTAVGALTFSPKTGPDRNGVTPPFPLFDNN